MSAALTTSLRALELRCSCTQPLITRRSASHQAQGRANKAKQGPGKRLGAKKTGGAYVVTGNIIYKQRGTLWFPGENCFMGRDHTIHAGEAGYVRYYQDPLRHPRRKYIGVALHKDQLLPAPVNVPRVRRLGMLAFQKPPVVEDNGEDLAAVQAGIYGKRTRNTHNEPLQPRLRPGYQYRIGNWEIGREAERVGTAQKVTPFRTGNRWRAWRQKTKVRAKIAEAKKLKRDGKKAHQSARKIKKVAAA